MTPERDLQVLYGVVLCGGQSRRMGRDKGLIPAGQTIRARVVADKLQSCGLPVVFSVNEGQLSAYSRYIPKEQMIIDSMAVEGPLKGLLSVHRQLPGKDLLLMACDMLDLDTITMEKLIDIYRREGGAHDYFVYQDQGFVQPFCGIYTSGGLARAYEELSKKREGFSKMREGFAEACEGITRTGDAIAGKIDGGSMKNSAYSLQALLNGGKTRRIEMDRQEAFRNYNSPGDGLE